MVHANDNERYPTVSAENLPLDELRLLVASGQMSERCYREIERERATGSAPKP